jgi:hypothetical protein
MKQDCSKPMSDCDRTVELWSRRVLIAAFTAFLGTWLYLLIPVVLQLWGS